MDVLGVITGFFQYLAHLPPPIADGMVEIAKVIIGISAMLVVAKNPVIGGRHYAAPIALIALAWVLRWLTNFSSGAVAEWLTFLFVIATVIGFFWEIIVLGRVLRGK